MIKEYYFIWFVQIIASLNPKVIFFSVCSLICILLPIFSWSMQIIFSSMLIEFSIFHKDFFLRKYFHHFGFFTSASS